MTDKPKRKNDQPIPRRYWWIFGILAILLLYPFPVPFAWLWWLNPILYGLIIIAFISAMVGVIWGYGKDEKPKRKNILPTPRRYWWILGILALVLLIGLRFPVKILHWWELNLFLYRLIAVACLFGMFRFVIHYHWKRMIVVVMLVCIVLAGWHIFTGTLMYFLRDYQMECEAEHHYIVTVTRCRVGGSWGADYISFRYIPVGIEYNTWSSL